MRVPFMESAAAPSFRGLTIGHGNLKVSYCEAC